MSLNDLMPDMLEIYREHLSNVMIIFNHEDSLHAARRLGHLARGALDKRLRMQGEVQRGLGPLTFSLAEYLSASTVQFSQEPNDCESNA